MNPPSLKHTLILGSMLSLFLSLAIFFFLAAFSPNNRVSNALASQEDRALLRILNGYCAPDEEQACMSCGEAMDLYQQVQWGKKTHQEVIKQVEHRTAVCDPF